MRVRYLLIAMLAAQLTAFDATAAKKKPPAPPPDPHAVQQVTVVKGPVRMASAYDLRFMQLVDEARQLRVYTQVRGIDDQPDSKMLIAPELKLTSAQINSRFASMIMETRRFQVFDDSTTVVREQAIQSLDGKTMDIIVEGMAQSSYQEILAIAPYRKVHTNVRLGVNVKDVTTGEQLLVGGTSVEGDWGSTQGEGTMLPPSASTSSAEVQSSMAADYQRALEKALAQAVERINHVLRPVARLTYVSESSVGIIGGLSHGFQSGDELVVFRPEYIELNGKREIAHTQPLAVIRCQGVGARTSQCDITHVDPRFTMVVGDFAVLSDVSAKGVREK
jgi:hypothetical protein